MQTQEQPPLAASAFRRRHQSEGDWFQQLTEWSKGQPILFFVSDPIRLKLWAPYLGQASVQLLADTNQLPLDIVKRHAYRGAIVVTNLLGESFSDLLLQYAPQATVEMLIQFSIDIDTKDYHTRVYDHQWHYLHRWFVYTAQELYPKDPWGGIYPLISTLPIDPDFSINLMVEVYRTLSNGYVPLH